MAYNFSATTNGNLYYNGERGCEFTPTRGILNNDLELFWHEVDLAAEIPSTKAMLYVAVNDYVLHMNYKKMNLAGADAINRNDQFHRTNCSFMIMELRKLTNTFKLTF